MTLCLAYIVHHVHPQIRTNQCGGKDIDADLADKIKQGFMPFSRVCLSTSPSLESFYPYVYVEKGQRQIRISFRASSLKRTTHFKSQHI
jgi:hypothetical protein